MRCLYWNVQGLVNICTLSYLRTLVRQHSPNLVFLSETRLSGSKTADIRIGLGFLHNFVVDCRGKNGGLMLLWSENWNVSIQSFSVGHIDAIICDHKNRQWCFFGFYGHPQLANRYSSWELLRRLNHLWSGPWLCGGDFNETLRFSERVGGRIRPSSASFDFQSALGDYDLSDIPFCGNSFT